MATRTPWLILSALLVALPLAADAPPRRNAVVQMEMTAYCTEGETASGEQTRRGIVAAYPEVLPLGSRVRSRAWESRLTAPTTSPTPAAR